MAGEPKPKNKTPKNPAPVYQPYNTASFPAPYNSPTYMTGMQMPVSNPLGMFPVINYPMYGPAVPAGYQVPVATQAIDGSMQPGARGGWNSGTAEGLSTGGTGYLGGGNSFPGWRGDGYSTNPNYNWWREKYGQTAYKWDQNEQGDLQLYANPNAPFDVAEPGQDIEGRDWSSVYSKDFYANLPATWRGDKARANFKQTYGFSNNPRTGTPYQMVGDNRMIKKGSPDGSGKISPGQLPEQYQPASQSEPVNLRDVPAWVGSLVNWRT